MWKEYIKIAEKFLCDMNEETNKSICTTIRISDIDNAENKEFFIKSIIDSVPYKFNTVTNYTDQYGIEYLMFLNMEWRGNIMKWKLFVYKENNINTWMAEKAFNKPSEILDMLEKYKGFWCRIVDLSTLEILLEGTFDNTYLEEKHYR